MSHAHHTGNTGGSGGRPVDLRPQFRLRAGQDDQLIAWLGSVVPRKRSQVIRDALRAHLNGQQRVTTGYVDEDPDLAAALDALF